MTNKSLLVTRWIAEEDSSDKQLSSILRRSAQPKFSRTLGSVLGIYNGGWCLQSIIQSEQAILSSHLFTDNTCLPLQTHFIFRFG